MGLFEPGRLGWLTAPKRIVMAPLGRVRNDADTREPGSLWVEYYAQRASGVLNPQDEATWYSGGAHGCTDYPTLRATHGPTLPEPA
ncbi:hypothetical protein [Novosphingobium rhizosphaerae]|uniref:hypothetical protein n=1 Tax=Novosphingobium rhizosphaerae TaxID=1551649 RepID=UPI00184A5455